MDTDKLTLQTILHLGYAAYERSHSLPDHVRRAVWALLACRTAVLGGHVQACPEGHVERIWYNSCRHRLCPPCAWVQVERWLAKQQARLLACDHYHVILTMPHELNELWLANVAVMTQLLFGSVHETLVERLKGIPEVEGPQAQKRPSEEILEEILNHTREQLRREDLRLLSSKESGEKLDEYIGVMTNTMRALDRFQGLFERTYANMQSFPPEIGPGSVSETAPLPNFRAMENVMQGMKELFDKQRVVQEKILHRHDEEAEPPSTSNDKSK